MTEYIDRESISEEIRKYYYKNPPNFSYGEGFDRGLDRAQRAILDAPAVDVAPVRHGRWIMKHRHRGGFHRYTGLDDLGEQHTITVDERVEYDDRYCSECGKQSADNFLNYCPNCGAKMDGVDDG